MVKQPYLYSYANPIFDFENDATAEARAATYVGEDSSFSANRLSADAYDLYIHDEHTQGGILLASGGLLARVEALEAQQIVSFSVVDQGDGTTMLSANRSNGAVTPIGVVDAAAADIVSFVATGDTVTITLADGSTLAATTADDFSVSAALNANTVTVTRTDGSTFAFDVTELNESLAFRADGYTLDFNDGTADAVAFQDGRISAAASNTIVRAADGGLYAPAAAITQHQTITILPNTFTMPPASDKVVAVPTSGGTLTLPAGVYAGQRLTVTTTGTGTTHVLITSPSYPLIVADTYGALVNANTYKLHRGESLTLVWSGASAWQVLGSHTTETGTILVFEGYPTPSEVFPVGPANMHLTPFYDPLSRWDTAVQEYSCETGASYTIITSLQTDSFNGAFSHHVFGNGAVSHALSRYSDGSDFAYSAETFHRPEDGKCRMRLRLINDSGLPVLIDPALLTVDRKLWRLKIYKDYIKRP